MLNVVCVLKGGGEYDAEWVVKLRKAVARHLSVEHAFFCLSDVNLPEIVSLPNRDARITRIPLKHGWPGWWSKIEVFREGVVMGPTLYLDLDTVLVGSIDKLADLPYDFAIMRNLNMPHMPGSAVMWFRKPQTKVYDLFVENPAFYMAQYSDLTQGCYLGDQAFIWDALDRKVNFLSDKVPGLIRSYRRHCMAGIPEGCSVVAFGGSKKPSNVNDKWVKQAWA